MTQRADIALGRTAIIQWLLLSGSSASDQIDDQHDYSDHQKQMDQRTTNVSKKAEKPKNKENYYYCPEHKFMFIIRFDFGDEVTRIQIDVLQEQSEKIFYARLNRRFRAKKHATSSCTRSP